MRWQPLEFLSRKWTAAQRARNTTEKETLALVLAIQKWRRYLEGQHFFVCTDHRNLIFLRDAVNRKVMAWDNSIADLCFDLVHVSGDNNLLPDMLSRCGHPTWSELPPIRNAMNDFLGAVPSTHTDIKSLRDDVDSTHTNDNSMTTASSRCDNDDSHLGENIRRLEHDDHDALVTMQPDRQTEQCVAKQNPAQNVDHAALTVTQPDKQIGQCVVEQSVVPNVDHATLAVTQTKKQTGQYMGNHARQNMRHEKQNDVILAAGKVYSITRMNDEDEQEEEIEEGKAMTSVHPPDIPHVVTNAVHAEDIAEENDVMQ
jgi:hypothetical protein